MSLPLAWADRIFDKLTVTYGQAFLARYRDIDLNLVKSDWMHELAVFEKAPHAIAFALSHLPERAPSVVDFKALCRQAPQAEVALLEAPKADPERMRQELSKLGALKQEFKPAAGDRGDWCHRILQRQADGAKISPAVITMAKEGLQNLGLRSRVNNHQSVEENHA